MRSLFGVLMLGGCSLIYNPNNLPNAPDQGEAGIPQHDAEIILDANPAALALTEVTPALVNEGSGVDGSRPAVLAIAGMQIVPGAMVSVARSGGGATTATVDNTNSKIASDDDMIAVPLTIGIDMNLGPTKPTPSYMLDVTVTNPDGTAKTMAAAVKVMGWDELAATTLPSGVHQYSQVSVATIAASDSSAPLSIRSFSSITLTGAASANASANAGGPCGGSGGTAGTTAGQGGDGGGMGKGIHNGGGGGFATAGGAGNGTAGAGNLGDAPLKTLAGNCGSGGAGGAGGVGNGGAGGGGGGAIELTAAGNLKIPTVTANGAIGVNGPGTGATDGGSGSGGSILLRWGGSLQMTPMLTATGAAAISSTGGKGGDGRIRVDAASMTDTVTATPAAYHGPNFLSTTPLIVPSTSPEITVTCQANMPFSFYVIDPEQNTHAGPAQVCGTDGKEQITLDPINTPIGRGINRMCVEVPGSGVEDATAEDRNCIQLAFIFASTSP